MIRSLDELARQADKFLEGEAVIEIDPADIDGSFVSDRLEDDEAQFAALKDAIAERGQDSPVLLRPHPERQGATRLSSAIVVSAPPANSGARSGPW